MDSHNVPQVVDSPHLPSLGQSFSPWVRHQTWSILAQVGAAIGLLLWIAEVVYYVVHLGETTEPLFIESRLKLIVDILHIFFIAVFIAVSIRFLDDNERGVDRVELVHKRIYHDTAVLENEKSVDEDLEKCRTRLRSFKQHFLTFWVGMFCLYIAFACQHAYGLADEKGHSEESAIHSTAILETTSSVADTPVREIWKSEESVTHSTVTEPASADTDSPVRKKWKQTIFPGITFFFNNITLIPIFACFLLMYYPPEAGKQEERQRKRWLRTFIVGVFLLCGIYLGMVFLAWEANAGHREFWSRFNGSFDALSGILNALVFALLITRLDSKLLGLRSWLICILYSYAAIQPLFAVFELTNSEILKHVTTSVLVFVFISKVYFFLIITYALQTGKMLNYFFCFPDLKEKTTYIREWSKDRQLTPVIIGILTIALFSIMLLFMARPHPTPFLPELTKFATGLLANAQVFLVVFLILTLIKDGFSYRKLSDESPQVIRTVNAVFKLLKINISELLRDKAYERLRKLNRNFIWFWLVTLGFYILLTLEKFKIGDEWIRSSLGENGTIVYPFGLFILSLWNLLFLFRCFLLLNSPPTKKINSDTKMNMALNYSIWATCVFIGLTIVTFFLVGGPSWEKKDMLGFVTVLNGIAGTVSALAIALLAARLSSRWFGISLRVICVILLYASIQPLFIAFNEFDEMTLAVLIAAFGLKMSFFMVVRHSLKEGIALNYLLCLPLLKSRVDSIIENHFDLRISGKGHNQFTILATKKNQLKFSTNLSLPSRAGCDRLITVLRHRMKRLKGRSPEDEVSKAILPIKKKYGAYWLELRSEQGRILFLESVPLRSLEEARELWFEAVEMIPYCRYNRL